MFDIVLDYLSLFDLMHLVFPFFLSNPLSYDSTLRSTIDTLANLV